MNIYDLINQMTVERKTIFDMSLKVTYYVRVSSYKEQQLNSQENQIQTFTEMIENNPNWTLVNGYVDTIRGESAANRDNFQRMIADAKNGKFNLIICKEISRFSRDLIDSISYTRELFQNNVGVFFVSDNLCTIDRDSELRLGIMASIAQQEVARLSERIKFGHKKAIENGVVIGNSRIFGFKKKDGKLILDEEESKMVRLIYQKYATGDYSLRKLSEFLFENGFKNHAGKPIAHSTIKNIIANPKNKGFYCGNKVKILDYRTKKQKFLPKEEWIMYKDTTGEIVPAIVDEALWERCNEMLKTRCTSEKSGNHAGKRFNSPLSGKIICSHCNKSYHHNSYGHTHGKIKYHWICSNKKHCADYCPSFSIKDDEMYAVLKEFFQEFIGNIDNYISKYIEIYKGQANEYNIEDEIKNKQNEIQKLEKKKEKLLDLYSDDLITKIDFKNRNDKVQEQLDFLKAELQNLCNRKDDTKDYISQLNSIKKYFSENNFVENSVSKNFIDELTKNLIEKIVIEPLGNKTANVIFFPKFNNNNQTPISRQISHVTNSIIAKEMLPLVTHKFTRQGLRHQGIFEYILHIFIKI